MIGCVKTETVVVTKQVATLPPAYLYDAEPIPAVPDNVPPKERTGYLLEGYASRGDALKRDQKQEKLMQQWVEKIRQLYPESVVDPLDSVENDADTPEAADSE